MHETMSPSIIGYVDNLYVTKDNLRISGWLVSKVERTEVVYYIDVGRPIAIFNFNERQDVADHYQTTDKNYVNCGFDVSIPVPTAAEITLYALVRGQKEVIGVYNIANRVETPAPFLASETKELKIRDRIVPEVIVVDDFYEEPDLVRELALAQDFAPDLRYHKGKRTATKFIAPGTKQMFEALIGRRITRWTEFEYNGIFQYCTAEDPLVYHSDVQSYAGAIYLTPGAPVETGTSFYRSKAYPGVRQSHVDDSNYHEIFKGGFYDKTRFEQVDCVGNVYNRLVLWNSKLIHSASQYFGTNKLDSRLFHLFFFDIEV